MVKRGNKVRFVKQGKGAKFGDLGVVTDPGKDGTFVERLVTVRTEKGEVKVSRRDLEVDES